MITTFQTNPYSYCVFQRINSKVSPRINCDGRPVRKVGFICEDESEQKARLGIINLAAHHAAKTDEDVTTLFNPAEEAA